MAKINVKYIDINQSGHSIKCKIFCEAIREIESIVVFLHGYGGHKDNKAAEHFADALLSKKKKSAVFVFDWPGHGTDVKKKITLEDCDLYLSMVLDYIQNQLNVHDICAYGTSFGGYLTLKYLHDHGENPFRKVALRCPAVSMCDVMHRRVMTEENKVLLDKGKDVLTGFDRKVLIDKTFLEGLACNDIREWEYFGFADDILIVHGTKDEMIPYEESKKFAEDNIIEFIEVEDADHRFQDLNKMKLAHSYMVDFYSTK